MRSVGARPPAFYRVVHTRKSEGPHAKELTQRIPMQRLGRPEEVAGVVGFLCSDDAGYLTGQTLAVNGGLC